MRTASPSLGRKRRRAAWAAEEDDGELGFAVLEGEVTVAAGGGTPVGDFAFDGDVAVGSLDEGADAANELADGIHGLRGVLRGVLRGRRAFGWVGGPGGRGW